MLFEFEDKKLSPIFEKVSSWERLSFDDCVTLWKTSDLLSVGYLANQVREWRHKVDYFIECGLSAFISVSSTICRLLRV